MAAGLWFGWQLLGAAALLLWARVGARPGGITPIAVDDPQVLSAARVAVEAFNRDSNDVYLSKLQRVVSAGGQVVSGYMYHLNVELARTVCRKTQARTASLEACDFHQDPRYKKRLMCNFRIWDQPWIGPMTVDEKSCRIIVNE